MAVKERKPISKKLRFDVFKRDLFKCQYCGALPTNTVLEVDHIIPVCKGGKNNMDNLLTSCFACNRGKGKFELTSLPISTAEKALILKEKLLQYKEYTKLTNELDELIQFDIQRVSEIYEQNFEGFCLKDRFLQSTVKKFIKELGVEIVCDAMYRACGRVFDENKVINYFCAICWNKIKGE